MTNLRDTIERLEALDKARTQGEWRDSLFVFGKDKLDSDMRCDNNYRVDACWPGSAFHPIALIKSVIDKNADAKFIAASPEMISTIRQLHILAEKMREALLFYCHKPEYSVDEQGRRVTKFAPTEGEKEFIAKQAIAAYDETMKG